VAPGAGVEAAITAIDYARNPAAQSPAGASQIVGVLYSNPSAACLSEFLVET
jgi:hypothetical protein